MENMFCDGEDAEVYIDDIGAFFQSWDSHMALLRIILNELQDNSFDESSPLVRKKAANVISNSESDNDNESLYSTIIDDKEILDCLLNLPCISSNKKQKKRHTKHRKIHDRKISSNDTDINQHCCHHQICHHDTETRQHCNHQHHCHHNVPAEQCYLNLPEDMVDDNHLDFENIKERQDEDDNLMQSTVRHPTWYSCKTITNVEDILCYTKPGDNADNWRIALPKDLILPTIKWYHQVIEHPGSKKIYE
jgi:hypothetical protein